MNPELNYGRALMGDSLAFHILFALLGVGIPLVVCLFEFLGLWKKDNQYYAAARRWSFAMATLFIVGAVSGIVVAMQLNVLWPNFMAVAGKVIGLPFFLEGFAFFIETVFLGIYLFTWDVFKNRWVHWLCGLPIVAASATSAFFITSANAWMNSPAGFSYHNGVVSNIDPVAALFNPATPTETSHSIFSYYLTTVLAFAGLYAFFLWKKRADGELQAYYKKIIAVMMAAALVFAVATVLTGDRSGKYLARYEPKKLAAAEGLVRSGSGVDLPVGGLLSSELNSRGESLRSALHLRSMLSFLATGDWRGKILGLDAFDPRTWPPLWVHYMFDLMVFLGIFVTVVPLVFLLLFWKKRQAAFSGTMQLAVMACGLSGFLAVEFGWMLTEIGRQPYAIAGIMTTAQAFTSRADVAAWGYIFPSFYILLFVLTPWVLRRYYRSHPLDLSINYLS